MSLITRPLEKRDIESVNKIFDQYWKDDFRNNLTIKLNKYFQDDGDLITQKFKFFVAEENGVVVGIDAMRILPEHMKKHASTNNPAEWYVAAVKEIGRGIGSKLMSQKIEIAKKEGYTEILLFSAENHKEAWKFHDKHFERVGPATAPNGDPGYIWSKML